MVIIFIAGLAYSQNNLRLKPGAKGEICLKCHVNFQKKIKRSFVHTPVKTGNCSACHDPHTSSHEKMLADNTREICYKCHKSVIPEKAVSAHKVVVEGNCLNCHDPHGSNNRFNLIKAGNDLCFSCHKEMGESFTKVKFKHNPVAKSCLNCHNPHASAKSGALLKDTVPSLCIKCHQTSKPEFAQRHSNYPVAKANCTSCHNPHGSDKATLLFTNVHKPFINKMCNQCHQEPNSPAPLKVKKEGIDLCKGCHSNMVNEIFYKNKIHWPAGSKKSCQECHTPHASIEKALLKKPMIEVCGKCHADTIERQKKAPKMHEPVKEGNCTACHNPHSSNNILLIQQPGIIELCGTCHEWQKHVTHPIGEKFIDPRNKNLTVDCLSCHRSHGTEYKNMLHFATVSQMCTQCHKEYQR